MLGSTEFGTASLQPTKDPISTNVIIAGLSARDCAVLAPQLTLTTFAVGDVIARAGDPIRSICFINEGIAGVLDVLGDERRYAVGLVGAAGFIGRPLILGDDRSAYEVVMRAESGRAL